MKSVKSFMKKLFVSALIIQFSVIFASALTAELKYSGAGTLKNWTEESYYASPVVTDLDNDGKLEIIFSNYSITVLDAETGNLKFRINSGRDRSTPHTEEPVNNGHTWSTPVVKDIDGDGIKEIITVHGHGLISVVDANGYFKPGWPQTPIDASARSLAVDDLDGDGKCEIAVGYGILATINPSVYVYNYDGTLRDGWPQLKPELQGVVGWGDGIYMNGLHIADLDNDGYKEVIVPTDNQFVSVYRHDGSLFPTHSSFSGRHWAQIGYFEDPYTEMRGSNLGWGFPLVGNEKREEKFYAAFSNSIVTTADLDNDGKKEIITSTIMFERINTETYTQSEYMTLAILRNDRTRFAITGTDIDWSIPPTDLGAPLVQNPKFLASYVSATPVVTDLDGDGISEIVMNSYNGKVHCFSLDKSEPYAWPYSLTKRTSPLPEYASGCVCVDLDGDGKKEFIFGTYYDPSVNSAKGHDGSLVILNYEGKLISKVPLPKAKEAPAKDNGCMAMPVVADIDSDGIYEIILNTTANAVCVYDIYL